MDTKKAVLRLEQGGKILQAGTNFRDFKVYDLEGLSGLDFNFNTTSNPLTPNTIINNKKPLPREIIFRIHAKGNERQHLNRFFNPYVKGRLTCTWGNTTRWIEYYSHPVKIVQNTIYRNIIADIKLICPEPYWKDMDDYGKNIASRRALLAFPFVMLPDRGLISDYRLFNTEVSIINNGDIEVGAKIVFTALGDVVNPALTINNNEYIKAIISMEKGDILIFNTDIDNLYVTLNGEDALNITDAGMSFFQIPVGESIIKYSSDEGSSNMQVMVYYTPQYIGL